MQTNVTIKDACVFVIGPDGNLVFGDCSSNKFAFAQAQFQPNAKSPKFAENFKDKLFNNFKTGNWYFPIANYLFT